MGIPNFFNSFDNCAFVATLSLTLLLALLLLGRTLLLGWLYKSHYRSLTDFLDFPKPIIVAKCLHLRHLLVVEAGDVNYHSLKTATCVYSGNV
mgnify:FL=1